MDRRQFTKRAALTLAVAGIGASAPACPNDATKERAVKYIGLITGLAKDTVPLLHLVASPSTAKFVETDLVPALEKLKDVIEDVNIPEAKSALATVRSVLGSVANALLNLRESPRRTTIIGILTSVNVLLLTVEAFVMSEMPAAITGPLMAPSANKKMSDSINKAFEASRP